MDVTVAAAAVTLALAAEAVTLTMAAAAAPLTVARTAGCQARAGCFRLPTAAVSRASGEKDEVGRSVERKA